MTGKIEMWVYEQCRWCWARCTMEGNEQVVDGMKVVGECSCGPECDDQEAVRDDAPLFAAAREWDAEIEALQRRVAELAAALGDAAQMYHYANHIYVRDISPTYYKDCGVMPCPTYAALTPTESEAT